MKRLAGLFAAVLFAASLSQAAIIVNLVSTEAGPTTGTNFVYDVDIATDTTARTGDYFVIYDFGPLLGSTLPEGWAVTSINFEGPVPPRLIPNDSASVANVQISRTGDPLVGPMFTGDTDYLFRLETPFSLINNDASFNVSSLFFDNRSTTGDAVDLRNVPVPSEIPEPSTLSMLGLGLFGTAYAARRRK